MCVARTAARRRKQIAADPRYGRPKATISRKLQGRSKLLAQRDVARANNSDTLSRRAAQKQQKQAALATRLANKRPKP